MLLLHMYTTFPPLTIQFPTKPTPPSPRPDPKNPVTQPPRTPKPTKWKCCNCDRTYNIGTAIRCLKCRHNFCHNARKISRRSSKIRSCQLVFDKEGWSIYNQWRLDITKHPDTEHNHKTSRDCYSRCSYPNECSTKHELLVEDCNKLLSPTISQTLHNLYGYGNSEVLHSNCIDWEKQDSRLVVHKNNTKTNTNTIENTLTATLSQPDKKGIINLTPWNIFDEEVEEDWYSAGF